MIERSPEFKALRGHTIATVAAQIQDVVQSEPHNHPGLHRALQLLLKAKNSSGSGLDEVRQAQSELEKLLAEDDALRKDEGR